MFAVVANALALALSSPPISSATQAVAAALAMPIAKPLKTRATKSHGVDAAYRNTSIAAAPNAIAGRTVRRLPIWSDSRPQTKRALMLPSTYAA